MFPFLFPKVSYAILWCSYHQQKIALISFYVHFERNFVCSVRVEQGNETTAVGSGSQQWTWFIKCWSLLNYGMAEGTLPLLTKSAARETKFCADQKNLRIAAVMKC